MNRFHYFFFVFLVFQTILRHFSSMVKVSQMHRFRDIGQVRSGGCPDPKDARLGPKDARLGPKDARLGPKDTWLGPKDTWLGPGRLGWLIIVRTMTDGRWRTQELGGACFLGRTNHRPYFRRIRGCMQTLPTCYVAIYRLLSLDYSHVHYISPAIWLFYVTI